MGCHIVRYNLNEKKTEYINKEMIRLSNFLPDYMSDIISHLPDEKYIFGVQYESTNDIQIGITGTVNRKENWKRTIIREMSEELKLYMCFNKIENKKIFTYKNKTWFVCSIDATYTSKSINQDFNQCSRIPSQKKVGVIAHGSFDQLYELLKTNYTVYKANDNISHIVILSVKWLKQYLDLIKKCNQDYITIN